MSEKKWKIGSMTPVKFVRCRAGVWSKGEESGYKLSFIFENQEGSRIYDGFYFKKGMSRNLFESTLKRTRHMVNVLKKDGWKDAGDFGEDPLDFLHKLSDQCNKSIGRAFFLKTLYVLYEDGRKIPKFGKTVRFIAPYVRGESLKYSSEEEENSRYVLD